MDRTKGLLLVGAIGLIAGWYLSQSSGLGNPTTRRLRYGGRRIFRMAKDKVSHIGNMYHRF